jgi:ankyrin repeat protein
VPASLTDEELRFLLGVVDLARVGDVGQLRAAIDAGVPANLTNAAGDSLLILAAYHQHLPVVELLLARGADVDRVNDRGQTALGAAVFRRSTPIVQALLAAGADPDAGARSARSVAAFFQLDDMTRLLDTQPPRTAAATPEGRQEPHATT